MDSAAGLQQPVVPAAALVQVNAALAQVERLVGANAQLQSAAAAARVEASAAKATAEKLIAQNSSVTESGKE